MMSKIADAVMVIGAVWFAISAAIRLWRGDNLGMRIDLLWSVVCIVNLRISALSDVIGKIVELLGLMLGHGK